MKIRSQKTDFPRKRGLKLKTITYQSLHEIALGAGWSLSLAEYEYSLRNTGTSLPKSVLSKRKYRIQNFL
jgi:hypothetical protein